MNNCLPKLVRTGRVSPSELATQKRSSCECEGRLEDDFAGDSDETNRRVSLV